MPATPRQSSPRNRSRSAKQSVSAEGTSHFDKKMPGQQFLNHILCSCLPGRVIGEQLEAGGDEAHHLTNLNGNSVLAKECAHFLSLSSSGYEERFADLRTVIDFLTPVSPVKVPGHIAKNTQEAKLYLAMAEILTTQKCYVDMLDVMYNCWYHRAIMERSGKGKAVLDDDDIKVLFSNIEEVFQGESEFLELLEDAFFPNPSVEELSDILIGHVQQRKKPYITYVKNFKKQEDYLNFLSEMKPEFRSLVHVQDVPQFEGDPLQLFRLMLQLPIVRIMQIPVQLAAVCRLLEQETKGYKLAMYALNTVRENVVKDCNNYNEELARTYQSHTLFEMLQFHNVVPVPLVHRRFIKRVRTEQITFSIDPVSQASEFSGSYPVHMFLFFDLVLFARNTDLYPEKYDVLDYCYRDFVFVTVVTKELTHILPAEIPAKYRTPRPALFTVLENQEGTVSEYLFYFTDKNVRDCWSRLMSKESNWNPSQTTESFPDWHGPMMRVARDFGGNSPRGVLPVERGDFIRVVQRRGDGWWEGENIVTKERGMFPVDLCVDVPSRFSKAQNLFNSYKKLDLMGTYLMPPQSFSPNPTRINPLDSISTEGVKRRLVIESKPSRVQPFSSARFHPWHYRDKSRNY
ncbi:unnamed protein product [Cyprideis torosa]|uniref:Uncharacterized protein n=1 Tax=Cyprideis torosa TaxID=163714 RepID=A0A7R8W5V5_9CRUS|nr:unnamed protein product [Cyprideis torosa]CAG0881852.1 unnamed protein product [Cyprideis torosa]